MSDTVCCIASGPSLTQAQVELVTAAHARGACHVAVVNNNWELFPDAEVLYAADGKWWDHYWPAVEAGFRGECWTVNNEAAKKYGLCWIKGNGKLPGLSRDPTVIHEGRNSGYQLIGLVYHFGVKRIILVGYDMQRDKDGPSHHHGDHPEGFANGDPKGWVNRYDPLGRDLQSEGVEIVNCSIRTALRWPRADLAATLAAL